MNVRECVYLVVKRIPKGKVTTYKLVSKACKTSPRAVGSILHVNKRKDVPCHRVVMSSGRLGGFAKGVEKKEYMLKKEGVEIKNGKINLKKFLFIP